MTVPESSYMPAVPAPMRLYQGDDKRYAFRVRYRNLDGTLGAPVDLTGSSVAAQIRLTRDAATPLVTFTASIADQTTSPGIVRLSLTGAQTAVLPIPADALPDAAGFFLIGVWDVQITYPDGRIQTYLTSDVLLRKQVTR